MEYTTYGIDTVFFRGPQIWQDLPQDIKNSGSLYFKGVVLSLQSLSSSQLYHM